MGETRAALRMLSPLVALISNNSKLCLCLAKGSSAVGWSLGQSALEAKVRQEPTALFLLRIKRQQTRLVQSLHQDCNPLAFRCINCVPSNIDPSIQPCIMPCIASFSRSFDPLPMARNSRIRGRGVGSGIAEMFAEPRE